MRAVRRDADPDIDIDKITTAVLNAIDIWAVAAQGRDRLEESRNSRAGGDAAENKILRPPLIDQKFLDDLQVELDRHPINALELIALLKFQATIYVRVGDREAQQLEADKRTRNSRRAALIGHSQDVNGKATAKRSVRWHWVQWQSDPAMYKNKASFARIMMDKYEPLQSQSVIERWCRQWERGEE
ncbi:hypothetical protein [Burkholderia sp. A9]|uniref:hypothetical protein n=1 Tax=Burkholderia sp. A9 TaxID=1365108 RepID=UPI00057D2272|nr:hypothetical protein [Burkholderia sp. A9]